MLLGCETDTQDTTGTILAENRQRALALAEDQVRAAVMGFKGDYAQIPPMYSALKVDGKKLYELARAGREVERQPRLVQILDIKVNRIELPRVWMEVTCSKGTYIRTLCHDIGRRLECGGCMEHLTRTRVDRFRIEDSLTLDRLEQLRDRGPWRAASFLWRRPCRLTPRSTACRKQTHFCTTAIPASQDIWTGAGRMSGWPGPRTDGCSACMTAAAALQGYTSTRRTGTGGSPGRCFPCSLLYNAAGTSRTQEKNEEVTG